MRFLCFTIFIFMSFYSCKTDHKDDSENSPYGSRSRSSGYESYSYAQTIKPEKLEKIVILDQQQGGALSLDNTDIAVISVSAIAAATALVLGGVLLHGKMTEKNLESAVTIEPKLPESSHPSAPPSQGNLRSPVESESKSSSNPESSHSNLDASSTPPQANPVSARNPLVRAKSDGSFQVKPNEVLYPSNSGSIKKIPITHSDGSLPDLTPHENGDAIVAVGSPKKIEEAIDKIDSQENLSVAVEKLEDGNNFMVVLKQERVTPPREETLPEAQQIDPNKISREEGIKILEDNKGTFAEERGWFNTRQITYENSQYSNSDITKILKWRLQVKYFVIKEKPEAIPNTKPPQWKITYKTDVQKEWITKIFSIAPLPNPVNLKGSGLRYYPFTNDMVKIVNPQ